METGKEIVSLRGILNCGPVTAMSYVTQGLLPKPVSIQGKYPEIFPMFYEEDIKKALKIEGPLGELINRHKAHEILEQLGVEDPKNSLLRFVAKKLINSYQIKHAKGTNHYFVRSQIENLLEINQLKIIENISREGYVSRMALKMIISLFENKENWKHLCIDERDMEIMKLWFVDFLSEKEIGERLDLTSQRVQQIIKMHSKTLLNNIENTYLLSSELNRLQSELIKVNNENKRLAELCKAPYLESEELKDFVLTELKDLEGRVPIRFLNCCEYTKIKTVGDLLGYSFDDLMKVRNMGRTTVLKVEAFLTAKGLVLKKSENQKYARTDYNRVSLNKGQ